MHTQPIFNLASSTNNIMSNDDRIQATLVDLELQEVFNDSITAKKHEIVYTILLRRFIEKIILNSKTNIEY